MHINKIGTMKYSGPTKTQPGCKSSAPAGGGSPGPAAQEGSGQRRHPRRVGAAGSPPTGGWWVSAGFQARDQNFCAWLHKASGHMNPPSISRLKISRLRWLCRRENPAEITP